MALTAPGLHDYVFDLLPPLANRRVLDIGAGRGAMSERLTRAGARVTAVDIDGTRFAADVNFVELDLNDPSFVQRLGYEFDLVVAIEIIEHLESPMAFLRSVRSLIGVGGTAVVTTPYMESLATRAKFLAKGRLRQMDRHGDPTHISPIFRDLLIEKLLPRADLTEVEHHLYPPGAHVVGRPVFQRLLGPLGRLDPALVGDISVSHIRSVHRDVGPATNTQST